jgi:hypothetical protein
VEEAAVTDNDERTTFEEKENKLKDKKVKPAIHHVQGEANQDGDTASFSTSPMFWLYLSRRPPHGGGISQSQAV